VQQAERRLAEDYADATAENLAALNLRATDLGAKIEALSGRLDEAVARRNALQIARAKTRELEQRRARLVQLEAEEPKIRAAEARLDAARRAAPIIPLITAARTAETRAAEAERLYAAAARQHAQTRSRRETAKKRLAKATKEADEIPQLVERIALLDQILGRMRPRPGLVKDLGEAGKQQAETARKLEEAHNANQKAAVELATARQRLLEAEAALVAVQFDSSLFEILDATRDEASRIVNLRAEVARRGAEVRSATDQLKKRETTLSAATSTAEKVGKDWGRAAQSLQAIDTQCSEARHRASAALLRRELRLGEPCPVCAQPVAEHPPALATPALDALEHKFERLQTAEAEARDCMEKARIAAAGAVAAVAAARDNLDQSTGRLNAADTELAGKRQALGESVGGHLAISADKPIEEQVQDDWRLLAAARRRHETAREARDNAERAVHGGEREEQRLGATVHQLSESLSQQQIRVAEITRQIADIDAEVRRVTQAPDPRAERAALDGRRTGLERALHECQVADGQTATELAAASASLEGSEEARGMAQEDARRASEAARTEAAAAGFPDAVAAAGAELGAPEQQRIGEQVRTHRDERRTVDALIGELVGELQGEEVAQEALDAAQNAELHLANDLADTRDSRVRLDEQMRSLTEKIGRAEELRKELESQREEHAVYRDLALDLRNDRFQAFLLEESFQALVAGASDRLWELTKRYRFQWQDEAFHVIDHDNARQIRSADTLSGGETFLASLALALQLSAQVQSAADARILDSLFIDEGFGTLDPEALDAAASAIESLPVGGRMVGIITHIDELSQRLPARVKVGKTPDGSRLTIEAG
jgi:exonuclease SbcC